MNDLKRIVDSATRTSNEEDTALIVAHLPKLEQRLNHLKRAFPEGVGHAVAIKTNPHPKMLAFLVQQGFGLEAASMEEVDRALTAGCPPEKIVFDSPVKTKREIARVSKMSGMLVNVNSLSELDRFSSDFSCTLGIRVNPQVHTGAPELFDVSKNESKFGVPLEARDSLVNAAWKFPVHALHMHSGSQMKDLDVQRGALESLRDLALEINDVQPGKITILDIGGGLSSEPLSPKSRMNAYGKMVAEVFAGTPFRLVTEFGQWVHAECGLALSRVEYVLAPSRIFIHLGADFFMRDAYTSSRPFPLSLWTAQAEVVNGDPIPFDIAGPLCFAGDYLAHQVLLPAQVEEGNWLVIEDTGANTYGLWSRHCSRTLPKMLAWTGNELLLWSERQSIEF